MSLDSKPILENVVSKDDAEAVPVSGEILCKSECLGNPTRLVLHLVGKPASEIPTTAQAAHHVAHVLSAGHDQDLFDAGLLEFPGRMPNHGHASDREQVLVGDFGQGIKPGASATRKNDPFDIHLPSTEQSVYLNIVRLLIKNFAVTRHTTLRASLPSGSLSSRL